MTPANFQVKVGDSTFDNKVGYHVRMLETPNGDLRLIRMNDWRDPRYKGHMLIPTKKFLKLAHKPSEDLKGAVGYFPDIKKDNRPLLQKDEYHSQLGLKITQVQAQSLVKFT